MALTQISTAGVKDDAVTSGKIPANAVGSSELADNAVDTAAIADGAVTAAKLASGVQTTINNNADNRVIIGSGTANTLNGESALTFSSNQLTVHQAKLKGNQLLFEPSGTAFIDHSTTGQDIQFRTSVSSSQDTTGPTIKSSGKVGIGTSSPASGSELDVNGKIKTGSIGIGTVPIDHHHIHIESANPRVLIRSTGTNAAKLMFGDQSNNDAGVIEYAHSTNSMMLSTGTVERMRIDSSGRVLIGTTTEGHTNGDEVTIAKDTGNMGITLRSGDSSNSHIYFSDATGGAGEYAGYIAYQHSDNSMHIGTDSSERIHIKSNGNVGIGTSSPTDKLHVNGTALIGSNFYVNGNTYLAANQGIYFDGQSNAAHHLDDYEEGTWTPQISFGFNTYNQSYYYQQGQYTKIGNRVFLTCYLQFSNKGTATGTARLGGLPFSNANITVNYAHGSAWINGWNGGATVPTGYVEVNSSNYRIERQRCDNPSSNFGVSTCDHSNFNNNTDIMLNMQYRVN